MRGPFSYPACSADAGRRRVWVPAVDEAALSPLTFHQTRHTAAAFMIDSGADPLQIKRRMGHENVNTTFDLYGHLFEDREEELVAGLDRRKTKATRSGPRAERLSTSELKRAPDQGFLGGPRWI